MKTIKIILAFFLAITFIEKTTAQEKTDTTTTKTKISVVIKNDGSEYTGVILHEDAREVLIDTKTIGQVIIPKHEIKEIRELKPEEVSEGGEFIPEEIFATRYFLTTNGLPLSKGESYIQWNLYGPDFQFGVKKNFGLGIMSTWFGVPIIGSAKYSIPLGKKTSLGIGTLLGTASWAEPEMGIALPYGALTLGNRRNNLNFSAGYGAIWNTDGSEGRFLWSVAGMTKVSRIVSIVFDSFIVAPEGSGDKAGGALLIPGIRLQTESNRAFQFGFAGLVLDGKLQKVPIPVIQWYRKL